MGTKFLRMKNSLAVFGKSVFRLYVLPLSLYHNFLVLLV